MYMSPKNWKILPELMEGLEFDRMKREKGGKAISIPTGKEHRHGNFKFIFVSRFFSFKLSGS